ncbi:MauE/DoxX family redox-associated membrane protein [Desulfopila inferna]|uniref:MauE/DoxX family redox-associated membrane protein n=1 Tax=Desulfopila inferna TaxID=468528 RepID=UPI001963D9D4|nr:MauE/DoxX family redox-associated membrane protein [Desulfopila inferna]MBM9603426.1 hypothetical protein [Desulfopila inferna]
MSKIYQLMEWPSRWLLALVFLYAGIPKLLSIDEFAGIIGAYGLLPEVMLVPAAFTIAFLEIVAAAGLLLRKNSALVLTTVLMGLFIGVLSYAIWLGLDIDCGCFGKNDPEYRAFSGLKMALLRDLFLLPPLVFLYRRAVQ